MATLPTDYLYSEEHEWVNSTEVSAGDTVRVGITHIAAEALGEIVFVELPEVGDEVEAGEAFGEVESTSPSLISTLQSLVRSWPSTRSWLITPR